MPSPPPITQQRRLDGRRREILPAQPSIIICSLGGGRSLGALGRDGLALECVTRSVPLSRCELLINLPARISLSNVLHLISTSTTTIFSSLDQFSLHLSYPPLPDYHLHITMATIAPHLEVTPSKKVRHTPSASFPFNC